MKHLLWSLLLPVAVVLLFSAAQPVKRVLAPTITILTTDGTYIEGVGLCFNVRLTNPENTPTTVDLEVDASSTAILGSDFTLDPQTLEFPAGFSGNMSVCVVSLEDQLPEGIETVTVKLVDPSNGAAIQDGSITFTFYDDDIITNTDPCNRLFFSEYIHSNVPQETRAIEIYNPAELPAVLEEYTVQLYFNGSTEPNPIQLEGLLLPGQTYVIAHPESAQAVLDKADLVLPLMGFTGDDAIGLYQNGELVDVIGVIGQDPGNSWPAGMTGNTSSNTLVRDSVIRQGETSWPVSAGHWRHYTQGYFDRLGEHFMLPCDPTGNIPPLVSFVTANAEFSEDIGGLGISLALFYPNQNPTAVNISVGPASTATEGADFTVNPTTVTFPANFTGNMSFGISINDDQTDEPDEILEIRLTDPSNNAILLDSIWTLTIQDNDLPVGTSDPLSDALQMKIFPNPVAERLNIRLSSEADLLSVTDLNGRVVLFAAQLASGDHSFHVKTLKPGVYMVNLRKGARGITRRFVKTG